MRRRKFITFLGGAIVYLGSIGPRGNFMGMCCRER